MSLSLTCMLLPYFFQLWHEGLGEDTMRSYVESVEQHLIDIDITGWHGANNIFNESFKCGDDDSISLWSWRELDCLLYLTIILFSIFIKLGVRRT